MNSQRSDEKRLHRGGGLQQALAAVCHYCPACEYGRRNPDSWIGRLLHHPWHADHCPMWRAEQAVYRDR